LVSVSWRFSEWGNFRKVAWSRFDHRLLSSFLVLAFVPWASEYALAREQTRQRAERTRSQASGNSRYAKLLSKPGKPTAEDLSAKREELLDGSASSGTALAQFLAPVD